MHHLQLPEDLLVEDLASIALQLEAVLVDSPEVIDIDASRLEHVDTAGMQLLYAFVRDARRMNKAVRWHHLSAAVRDAAQVLGMDALFPRED
ncbi:MAG: STAS domain-containing protein [Pseudomonadota bacterium]